MPRKVDRGDAACDIWPVSTGGIIAHDVLRSRAGGMMRETKDVLITTSLPLSNVIIEGELLSDNQLAFGLVELICRYFQV